MPKEILLVEDDATLLLVGVSFLARLDVNVHEAASGNKAIRMIEDGLRPDIVLSGYEMTDGSGADLLDFVRSNDHILEIPFMVLTSCSDENALEELWRKGCTDLYRKPIRYESMLKRVAEHLNVAVRRAKRHTAEIRANLHLDEDVIEVMVVNISSTGVFMLSMDQFNPDRALEIMLNLPGREGPELVTMNIDIVRETRSGDDAPFGYGAIFLPTGGESRMSLNRFLALLDKGSVNK